MKTMYPQTTGDQQCQHCRMYQTGGIWHYYTRTWPNGYMENMGPLCSDCYSNQCDKGEREKVLDKLTALGQELGLYDTEIYYDENGRVHFKDIKRKSKVELNLYPASPHDPNLSNDIKNATYSNDINKVSLSNIPKEEDKE